MAQAGRRWLGTLAGLIVAVLAASVAAKADIASVVVDGVQRPELVQELRATLNQPELMRAASPGHSSEELDAAIETESARLASLLRAFGYLDETVEVVRIATSGKSQSELPYRIEFRPTTGPLFRIGQVHVTGIEGEAFADLRANLADVVTPLVGKSARSDTLTKLENSILWNVRGTSRPYARVVDRSLTEDPTFNVANVRLVIDPGQVGRFGAVTFLGAERFELPKLEKLVPFAPGDPYSPDAMLALKDALSQLPGLRSFNINLAPAPDAGGQVGVEVNIRETAVDPDKVARNRGLGIAALGSLLLLLAFRQTALAAGALAVRATDRPAWARAMAVAALVMLAGSVWLVVQRLIAFSNLG